MSEHLINIGNNFLSFLEVSQDLNSASENCSKYLEFSVYFMLCIHI